MKLEDYSKYYIQSSDHYLIPKEVFIELFNEMINWKEENAELKKQLEDANEKIILLQASEPMLNYKKALEETQQQEFIKYLENEINYIQSSIVKLPVISNERNYLANLGNNLLRVLEKYKETIGVKNENNT